jgi:hypothetical protein
MVEFSRAAVRIDNVKVKRQKKKEKKKRKKLRNKGFLTVFLKNGVVGDS